MKTYLVEVHEDRVEWKDPETRKLHREEGPAIEYDIGSKYWYLNGKLHREDGPAIEYDIGSKYWYLNGERHREDGPAIEYNNGSKHWYLNGKLHREDGPAIEFADGSKEWYLNCERLTEKEFLILSRANKPKELSIKELEEILGYPVKIIKE